jgi:hypothetical protein
MRASIAIIVVATLLMLGGLGQVHADSCYCSCKTPKGGTCWVKVMGCFPKSGAAFCAGPLASCSYSCSGKDGRDSPPGGCQAGIQCSRKR